MNYYILSIKHSPRDNRAVWWRPNCRGYTTNIDEAGLYSQQQIESKPDYFHKSGETLPVQTSNARNLISFSVLWDDILKKTHLLEEILMVND